MTVTLTNGNLDFSDVDIEVASLRIDCSSGKVRIGSAYADTINLSNATGTLDIACLEGKDIDISATSGKLVCDEIPGNVTYSSTSDNIEIQFEAATKNGSVSIPFGSVLSINNDTVMGTVGDNPSITVKTETRNGDIMAEQ